MKAAFLYNFAAFTDWPADVGRALNVCLFGGNPFGPVIDAINGKTVGGRIVALQRNVNTDTVAGCQVVFVPAAVNAQLPAVLQTVRSLPVLVVAESAGAAGQGATINMSVIQNRVVFEANLGAARRARLGLNARLLRLATEVIQ